MTEEALFELAFHTPAAERPALLDRVCADDPALRARVEALLAADATLTPFVHSEGTRTFSADERATRTAHLPTTPDGDGSLLAGKYKLLERIGEGGMGSVWLAQQSEPVKRQVAVKLIKPGMDSRQVIARFEAERQALAMMDHPNIAKVLDGGLTPDDRPFFVMELVKGLPITEYCDAKKLTPNERLELFGPVCHAIQHAHQKGIIHRDIKPSNVMIALYDDKPVPKVIDFGVAKATGQPLTENTIHTGFGGVVGTPQYMSPEQATFNNVDIDTRSDVYSLGILLYELLAGSPPFSRKELEKKGLMEMLRVVREDEPPKPSAKLSTADAVASLSANRSTEPKKLTALLRSELDWIVLKALEKDRTRRYETANAFAADVQRYLAGEAVLAHPPSRSYRLKKAYRKNRGPVLAVGGVSLALLLGIVGTGVGLVRAKEKERVALAAVKEERQAKMREAAQLAIAVDQRTKAEKARDRTREVLDAMTSIATGDMLATQKVISEDQKKFLQGVLGYYREFAGENADDEFFRQRQVKAAFRVGLIECRLGRKEESVAAFHIARSGYAALANDYPTETTYCQNLARCHCGLGVLLDDLGKGAEAVDQIRAALAIQTKLSARFPAVPEYRQDLATSQLNLGKLLTGLGKVEDAEVQTRRALAIQEKLAADHPAVPEYRQNLARCHGNLGSMQAGQSEGAKAADQFRRALAIQAKLATEFPAVPEYSSDLAGSHDSLGNVLAGLGNWAEAEEQYRKAFAIQTKLSADFPIVPLYRQSLARCCNNLGVLLKGLGKGTEAADHYRRALAVQAKLAADFPAVPEYSSDLAASHSNLANLLVRLGRQAEAVEQYRKALAIREKLAADFPANPGNQVELGCCCYNYGSSICAGGDPADSLKWFDRAIEYLQPLRQKEPRDATVKVALRNSYWGRAEAHNQLDEFEAAVKNWDRAIALSSFAEQPRLRAIRARSRLQSGMVAEAVAEVAELTKTPNWDAAQWYDFACIYSLASSKIADQKQEYADRAMVLLQKAVKAGYKDASHMKKDTDLDPLRERDDFKKLLSELEKAPEKK